MSRSSAPAARPDATAAVTMRGISKAFNGVRVLHDVDFELRRGEVHALAGENGAGKSTLMKILQGVHPPDGGTISVEGARVRLTSPQHARAAGIGMVFQEMSLVPTLTVAQNISLNHEPRTAAGLLDDRAAMRKARKVLTDMGVTINPKATLAPLSTAQWQLTEIAKALAQDARILIMDEPTASLAKHESEALFALIDRLKAGGISVIYISHRMDDIDRVADRITVLRDGHGVLTANMDELTPGEIIEAIVGQQMEESLTWRQRHVERSGQPLLDARHLRVGQRVRDVSFQLHAGEILGLAGLMGSGRTELARCLFGIDPPEAGEVYVRGTRVATTSPGASIKAGLALIPEDRREQGLVLAHTVRSNLLLPFLHRLRRGPLLDDRKGASHAASLVRQLRILVPSLSTPTRLLSGGNQQKIVIAKWLGMNPDVLIMDEPTAGVDIGTKNEIVTMIRELADSGRSVILISSELPELLAVSDRVLVLRNGSVAATLDRSDIPNQESLQLRIQGV